MVCAGLDLSELMPRKPINNTVVLPDKKKFRFAEKKKGAKNAMAINN